MTEPYRERYACDMTDYDYTTFEPFPKITRYLKADCVITEKVDGTNAALAFEWDGTLTTQSRTRVITPEDDNYGFARWAVEHSSELFDYFGPGRHFGEWWGRGVQKRYGQFVEGKYFTPFNAGLFTEPGPAGVTPLPVLWEGPLKNLAYGVKEVQQDLEFNGSRIAPGAKPEGIMIWSQAFGYIKHPFDDGHKWTRSA